jgi:enamine deaminase RidA (YjgF/YER057c/UK114 family)
MLAYSRLISIGDDAWVSGCAPLDPEGAVVGIEQPGVQASVCIDRIREALETGGFNLKDVVRLRIYVRSFEHVEPIARAQREAFDDIRPACTVIAAGLVTPEILVYMDADARRARP